MTNDAVELARRIVDEVWRSDREPVARLANLAALRDALDGELGHSLDHAVYEARAVADAPTVAAAYGRSPRSAYAALSRFCASHGMDYPVPGVTAVLRRRNRQDLGSAIG